MNMDKVCALFLANVFTVAPLLADDAAKPAGTAGLLGMAPWVLIFVIFYFLLIRPQQKQAKEQQKMVENLKRGDRVLTQGGFYATIVAVKGKVLEVRLNDDVKVLMAKSAVTQVVSTDPAQEPETVALVEQA